ncbi:hypothetical protein D030_5393A, partial [Vibrio parahaemolyticus AQ3810]|jgi:hypothetical protein
MFSR